MRTAMASHLSRLQKRSGFHRQITHSFPVEAAAFFLAHHPPSENPQVVVTADLTSALRFKEAVGFWNPGKTVVILPPYQPGPYSGVQYSPSQVHERLAWLHQSINSETKTVFVAPIQGLLQKTISSDGFLEATTEISVGDELPESFYADLHQVGYVNSPMVEDRGSFTVRNGIVDIFSPQMEFPVRLELFGDEIESIRQFDPHSQRTLGVIEQFTVIPAREILLSEKNRILAEQKFLQTRNPELHALANHLKRNEYCENLEFYLPLFEEKVESPLNYFSKAPTFWMIHELDIEAAAQDFIDENSKAYEPEKFPVAPDQQFFDFVDLRKGFKSVIAINTINILESSEGMADPVLALASKRILAPKDKKFHQQVEGFLKVINDHKDKATIIVAVKGEPQFSRLKPYVENEGLKAEFLEDETGKLLENLPESGTILFVERAFIDSILFADENLLIMSYGDFFGRSYQRKSKEQKNQRGAHLSFGEIKAGDFVVHGVHGVCQFVGLETMNVGGVEGEFLVLSFKEKDKLFLPIYRIHQIYKYASESVQPSLDKLGGNKFQNVKTKTKKRLREIANDLIQLYARRSQSQRPAFDIHSTDVSDFFNEFPYEETEDQLKAIGDIITDLGGTKPMDRLICGDVGFGKTEVAMRAAFVVASQNKQVAVLAPTTVLTMQHLQTFQKRFKNWPLRIEVVNRLIPTAKVKKIFQDLKAGQIDILIGTHRLLSQDVGFNNLGLLIVDEEQKFGVTHKEKIRKLKYNVDTLALSATPIPRTLNLSLLGIRDLSLIHTAPVDRLETRTFICKYNDEIIRKAIESELKRGGQVFFLHNRVQSIYGLADELRSLLPKARIGVGHGQLKEKELESVMMSFFKGELDILLSTTIVESGMDIPNANTILINKSENFGLSQLYQLRGRVGRSGRRAYCYLLTDTHKPLSKIAKERLKVIQENTALGSGLQIAQYDLELRGAGTLLGEEQSGLIDTVGYEFYMELLDEAIKEAKGEKSIDSVEPEMNLKIRAFIPDSYIPNIRLRLSYYRALTEIRSENDIDDLEEELKDQFGKPPEEVINLLGLMLIRYQCLQLGVKDLSSGKENIILNFTPQTPLPPEKAIALASQGNKKYMLTPDNRLKVRMKDVSWPKVYDEVSLLLRHCRD